MIYTYLVKIVIINLKCMSVLTMPKFTSQILLLFSKVLHILENLLLKNFTGLKVSMSCFSKLHVNR